MMNLGSSICGPYEAKLGRFLSEDPAQQGNNWMTFCRSNPISFVGESGKSADTDVDNLVSTIRRAVGTGLTAIGMILLAFASIGAHIRSPHTVVEACKFTAIGVALVAMGSLFIFDHNPIEDVVGWGLGGALAALQRSNLMSVIQTIVSGPAVGNESAASAAVAGVTNRALQITAALFALDLEEDLFR